MSRIATILNWCRAISFQLLVYEWRCWSFHLKREGGTSEIISSLVIKTATNNEISDKVIAFYGDNCATNFGSRKRGGQSNVFYRLKQCRTSLIGIECAAYIVHNALKFAWDQLPLDVEYIVVKIYSQFYRSTVQVEALRTLCDDTDGVGFIKLLGYAKTRFLALRPAIGSILKLFVPLKEYYMQLRRWPTILKTFFESPFAKLWLLFIKEQVS